MHCLLQEYQSDVVGHGSAVAWIPERAGSRVRDPVERELADATLDAVPGGEDSLRADQRPTAKPARQVDDSHRRMAGIDRAVGDVGVIGLERRICLIIGDRRVVYDARSVTDDARTGSWPIAMVSRQNVTTAAHQHA